MTLERQLSRLYNKPLATKRDGSHVTVRAPRWEKERTYEETPALLGRLSSYEDFWGVHPAGDRDIRNAMMEFRVDALESDEIAFKVYSEETGQELGVIQGFPEPEMFDSYDERVKMVPDENHERRCIHCGDFQFLTPHGWVCQNGHGGGDGVTRQGNRVSGVRNYFPSPCNLSDLEWYEDVKGWFEVTIGG